MQRWQEFCKRVVALTVAALGLSFANGVMAEDSSPPAILQMFEAKWTTIENRMADIFQAGYGQMWLPPPQRADQGDGSVGYDVFNRFDLGGPRNETLYGTETSLKTATGAAHRAGVSVYTDLIWNHNGFTNLGTVDTRGTPSTADDVSVEQAGGYYPGFVLKLPADADGDFHGAFESGDHNGRLAGLIDIAQEKNHQFIRQPTTAGNPQNIPAGTIGIFGRPPANLPDPNNARFYPDQQLPGLALNGGSITRYPYNTSTPLDGDPVPENATGLLMRNAQWMVEVVGVDGFRIDAAKHMPPWVLGFLDEAVFRANPRLQHDGSFQPVFSFSEVLDGNRELLQSYIRKNLPNPLAIHPNDTNVGGNRDVLDFPLFYAMRDNLSGNGFQNNWHSIKNASQDTQDDGQRNGSQGVAFVDSHDNLGGGFPYLYKVAYAYTLMRPGNAIVYLNAKEFGQGRDFPHDEGGDSTIVPINPMSNDALGGIHGGAVSKLVEIRNSHGRGNFHERWIDEAFDPNGFSNIYIYERENSAIVGLNSRVDIGYDERTPVQTGFAPDSVLVELTGNADNPIVDAGNNIPKTIRVDGSGRVTMRVPRNKWLDIGDPEDPEDDEEPVHGLGYVVYGLAAPQGTLSLTNVTQTMQGATPTAANNGTARLADVDVITANSFNVRLDTTPVTLPAPFGESNPVRDFDADGDQALLRIDGGINVNNLPGVDVTAPGDVSYGFEQFTGTHTPGFTNDGVGVYEQQVDATQLAEGRHYITVRAFRHRTSGPAVYSDFKRTIYVDRLPPEAAIVSFEPYASNPNNPNNRDLIVRSVDQTADNMHMYLDLPANMTDAQIFQLTQAPFNNNDAGPYDRDSFIFGFDNQNGFEHAGATDFGGVTTGNHVATIVTFEPTGNYNVQRFTGLFTDTNIGAGFGDLDYDNVFEVNDIRCVGLCSNNSAEDILYSQNSKFRASFDVNGDGLGDNRDLFALGDELLAAGAGQAVLDSYVDLLLDRGDVNASGTTDSADVALLYSYFGVPSDPDVLWLMDMNVDGIVNINDVSTMIAEIFRSVPSDFNLDGRVNAADYPIWRNNVGAGSALFVEGDANLNAVVDADDVAIWRSEFGFIRQPLMAGSGSGASAAAVPEPQTLALVAIALATIGATTKTQRTRSSSNVCSVPFRARSSQLSAVDSSCSSCLRG